MSAAAAAPRVTLAVVGRGGQVLRAPRAVSAATAVTRLDGRRCRIAAATPMAALLRSGLPVRARADGACTASAVFVTAVGSAANAGRDGWAYKVGRRAGTTSAADPSGPFGTGRRLGRGQVVTWFWCVLRAGGCQRTLTARALGAGRVRVVGYDDAGHGLRVARALVTAVDGRGRRARGRTDRRGEVRLHGLRGPLRLTARRGGMVPALAGGAR